MSAEAIFVILGTMVALIVALASLMSWVYKLGQASGADRVGREANQAKIEALVRQLAETQADLADTRAELATLQPGNRNTNGSPAAPYRPGIPLIPAPTTPGHAGRLGPVQARATT